MLVYLVNVSVKPERIKDFIDATKENHNKTIQEEGNLRFDVIQNNDDPTQFVLYEAYQSEEAVIVHKQTEHYLFWKELVAGWMAKPRIGIKHKVIAPASEEEW